MTLNGSLNVFFEDTVLIAAPSGMTGAQVYTYGSDVSYPAIIQQGAKRITTSGGKEVDSNVQIYIPDRVFVDPRSRITLPAGFVPNQPPILAVTPLKFQDLDHTMVAC
jgi:hypothetical protein